MNTVTRARDVSAYIINRINGDEFNDLITNLKLQKLLYFAQGIYGALKGQRLFADPIEAWDMGPVVPNEYHQFKACGRHPIEIVTGGDEIESPEARMVLNVVCDVFGKYSAGHLVWLTHQDVIWDHAYKSGRNTVIKFNDMAEYFRGRWLNDLDLDDHYDEGLVDQIQRAYVSAQRAPEQSAEALIAELGL